MTKASGVCSVYNRGSQRAGSQDGLLCLWLDMGVLCYCASRVQLCVPPHGRVEAAVTVSCAFGGVDVVILAGYGLDCCVLRVKRVFVSLCSRIEVRAESCCVSGWAVVCLAVQWFSQMRVSTVSYHLCVCVCVGTRVCEGE